MDTHTETHTQTALTEAEELALVQAHLEGVDIPEFISYCLGFYGADGLWGDNFETPFTEAEIRKATGMRLTQYDPDAGEVPPFDGDSMDREQIRGIVMHQLRGDWTPPFGLFIAHAAEGFLPLAEIEKRVVQMYHERKAAETQ